MKGKQIAELNVNEEIKSKKLLVIAPDGVQVGELELKKALILAEELELDLVEVSPESKPPVARLMDYGKYKYELNQKARESRKKQVKINVKEIQLKPKIDTHDYKIKLNQSKKFFTLNTIPLEEVDMLSILIIGNSQTTLIDEIFLTPRGYLDN